MIVPINLERLSGDGYKMNANSPLVTPPTYIKYAQLRYTPFTSAEAIQGTFVAGAYSTVEFDITGANLTRYLKLYTSTDGTTYNEVKSWGGTAGIRVINPVIEVVGGYSITSTTGDISFNSPAGAIEFNSGVNFIFNAETTIALTSNTGDIELVADGDITLSATSYSLANLPVYANNAAAITGGLGVNKLYRTSTGDLKIVYNP